MWTGAATFGRYILGDAIVYGYSLHVVARDPIWQVRAAMLKSVLMAVFGVGVLTEAVAKVVRRTMPTAEVMGTVGARIDALAIGNSGAPRMPLACRTPLL